MTPTHQNLTEQIPPDKLERYRDAAWAMNDPEVQRIYDGQYVIAYQRKVIAHSADPKVVSDKAQLLAKGQVHFLVYCAQPDTDIWLKHPSEGELDFTDA